MLLSLKSAINTKTAQQGDGVYLVSSFPVVGDSRIMIPVGVYVQGVVDRVAAAGPGKGTGATRPALHHHDLSQWSVVEVPGVLNSLPGSDGPKVKDSEGTVEQAGNKGRDVGNVLKGAAIGAEGGVIGGAETGDLAKGVGYGSLAGAAAGTIYTLFTRGNDIVIPSEHRSKWFCSGRWFCSNRSLPGRIGPTGRRRWFPPANRTNAQAEAANSVSVREPGLQLNGARKRRSPDQYSCRDAVFGYGAATCCFLSPSLFSSSLFSISR